MKANLIVILGLAAGLALGGAAHADANLVPNFNVNTGTVKISNTGADAAGVSFATVECNAMGGGTCPDPTPAQAAPYTNPAFPNKVTILTIPLNAGAQHNHVIAFYGSLDFDPGTYVFTVCADAGADVDESSEGDNCKRFKKVVRKPLTGPGGLTSNTGKP